MTSSTPIPPDVTDEKSKPPYGDAAASSRALAEVSEALNGLRELASRVTPAKAKSSSRSAFDAPEAQLALELPKSELPAAETPEAEILQPEPQVSIGVSAEPAEAAPEPVAIVVPPARPSVPARKPRVGETLRDARESAGFSLEEVADEIKIKEIYLQAIEEGRYGDLPSRTYAVGFVRSYAQALGLHTEELVARCRAEVGTAQKIPAPPLVMREPMRDRRMPGGALIAICVVLAVVVYAASYSLLRPTATTTSYEPPALEASSAVPVVPPTPAPVAAIPAAPPVAAAPQPQPAPVAAAPAPRAAKPVRPTDEAADEGAAAEDNAVSDEAVEAAPVPARQKKAEEPHPVVIPGASAEDVAAQDAASINSAKPAETKPLEAKPVKAKPPSRIKLRAVADTSVRITDAEGRVMAERVIRKGESFYVPDHQHYTLATTNAGALHLSVDGRDMPPLGDAGEAMHNIPLDAADLTQVLGQ